MKKGRYISALLICMFLTPNIALYAQDIAKLFTQTGYTFFDKYAGKNVELPAFMQEEVSIKAGQVPLSKILTALEKQLSVYFVYKDNVIDEEKRYSVSLNNTTLHETLSGILKGTGIDYFPLEGGYIVLKKKQTSDIRLQAVVTGTVTDAGTGETLPGANVSIEGTTRGASTDTEGRYSISGVEPGTYTFVASFVGYQEARRIVTISEGQETVTVNFVLQSAALGLEELVVVGYGQQERSDVTASISSVTGEDLNYISTANFAEALQGQAAGVLVTQNSGAPGSDMEIVIRGAATLGDTDPLYIIDGVPAGSLSEINMANIASIDILKDASAAAIYGSRASNGVVMVTTKRGHAGATQVQFNASAGINTVPESRRLDMMNTAQFHEYSVDAYTNAGLPVPLAWQEPYLSQNLQQNTDWQDEMFRSASVQEYNLSVSGGNEDAVYYFSTGYRDEEGIVINNGFNRASFRINSEFYIGEDQRLTIGENLALSQTTSVGGAGTDTFKETFQQSPTVKLRCPENLGGFCGPTSQTSPGFRLNQVALLYLEEEEDIAKRLLGTAYAIYDILPNLSYRLNLSADLGLGEGFSYAPVYDLVTNSNADADVSQSRSENRSIIIENTLNYNLTLNDVHEVDVLVGYTQESNKFESISGDAEGFPSPTLRTIDGSTGQTTVNAGASENALRSFLGRVQYEYDDRYRASFVVRRDGSSRFGSESRWGTFPSASASWTISNEDFFDSDQISRLTLRASWGVTGSQNIGNYAAIPTVEFAGAYIFGVNQNLSPGAVILELGNPNLQWQETQQTDIGLDISFLDNRLTFIADYFTKNTSNLLLGVPVATSSGIHRGNGADQNVGEIKNTGFEFAVGYQQSMGDFSYSVNANIATFKNEVIALAGEPIIDTQSDELGEASTITQPGSEVGAFYGWISLGPFNDQAEVDNHATQPGAAPGDLVFKDLNGDGEITTDDRTIIGSPFPDFFYGLTVNLNYRNWGLRVQMDGVQGRDIFAIRSDNSVRGFNNTTTDYLDRWTPENRDGTHPRAINTDPNDNLRSSTYRVEDGSFLAVRNITLGYNFDPNMLSQWVDVRNLRLYANLSNPLWLTGYDGYNPEIGGSGTSRSMDEGSYPIPRGFEVGIDIGF